MCKEYIQLLFSYGLIHRVGQKNDPIFLSGRRQIFTKFDNFWHTDSQELCKNHVRYTHCPPCVIYVAMLPCEMQMLQNVA